MIIVSHHDRARLAVFYRLF